MTTTRNPTRLAGPRSVLDLKRPPTSPGEMLLEEFLRPAGLTQVEAAARMAIPLNRLNEISAASAASRRTPRCAWRAC